MAKLAWNFRTYSMTLEVLRIVREIPDTLEINQVIQCDTVFGLAPCATFLPQLGV